MHIQVDDIECCLCDGKVMETNEHLFEKCTWMKSVWQEISEWTGIALQKEGINQVLGNIKKKHWKQFKEEVIAAICGAVLHHLANKKLEKVQREACTYERGSNTVKEGDNRKVKFS